MLKSRTIAIAGSIAALSFAAVPVAQAATPHHNGARAARVDTSRDARGDRHSDRTPDRTSRDRSSPDRSRDIRDR
jgi:Ni/Co efflux regulator RcnB